MQNAKRLCEHITVEALITHITSKYHVPWRMFAQKALSQYGSDTSK